jgi:hypothetical protein
LLRDERGNVAQDVGSQALDIAGIAWRLPKRLDGLVSRFENGTVAVASPALERRVARLERSVGRVVSAVLFGGLLIAGAVLRADETVLGTVLMAGSAVPLLHALFAGRRG